MSADGFDNDHHTRDGLGGRNLETYAITWIPPPPQGGVSYDDDDGPARSLERE